MSTGSPPRLMTAEEFMDADLGEGVHELVRGKVVESPPSNYEHGSICYHICGLFWEYTRRTGYGHGASNDSSIQTQRDPDTVRSADFMFFSNARWPKPGKSTKLPPIAPDVATEVVSPGDRRGEIQAKVGEYLQAGTLAVWVAYLKKRAISIYRDPEAPADQFRDGDVIEDQPELPGFRCTVTEVFDG